LILDEADELFEKDSGFDEQIDEILSNCTNPNICILLINKIGRALFSATLPFDVEQMAKSFLRNPITIIVGIKNSGAQTIDQKLVFTGTEAGKAYELRSQIRKGIKPPVLIFVQTIERAQELYKEFQFDDFNIEFIHGKRTQGNKYLLKKLKKIKKKKR
jgi:ATP-dependent RNA helicase DDX52/ROK1